uniref:Ribosomal protein L19 n=1 Tax=Rhodogorgon sp. TaxID=2485824 RepID=A0A3G3MHV7_9FLOR|nr:ribosomal protein L19 [Rhodogorgon sp.]
MSSLVKPKFNLLRNLENKYKKKDLPLIEVGDTLKIGVLIREGNKERIQFSEGVVISKNKNNINTTITMRKVVQGVGVEKVYLIHSPRITQIRIIKKAKIRRAKLYYIRHRSGKNTRLKQKFI